MCGIGSITVSNKATKEWDLDAGAKALLLELDSRGKDACGMMAIREDGSLQVQKAAVRAPAFIMGMYPVNAGAKAVAVHTRFATKGSKDFPKNNHPVACGDAHIIHNGVVDDFDTPRIAGNPEVDTFALSFALWGAEHAEGIGAETPRQYAKRLATNIAEVDGSAAIIAVIEGKKVMLTAKLTGSPLYFAEAEGVRIAASTRKAVEDAADAMDLELPGQRVTKTVHEKGKKTTTSEYVEKIETAAEGRVLSWNDGAHNMLKVPLPTRTFKKSWRNSHSHYSDHGYGYMGSVASVNGRNGYWREGEWSWYPNADRSKPKNPEKPTLDYEVLPSVLAERKAKRPQTPPSQGAGMTGYTGGQTRTQSVAEAGQQRVDGFLYPLGTPQPQTPEYDALRRIFLLWRKSGHGLKWAREFTAAAASYDAAVERTQKHGNLPPFPTPRELAAMHADPLFEKQLDQVAVKERHLALPPTRASSTHDGAGFVADSCGVVTVAGSSTSMERGLELDALVRQRAEEQPEMSMREIVDSVLDELDARDAPNDLPSNATMQQIVNHMLADRGLEHTGAQFITCDLCREECDDVLLDAEGNKLCGDCSDQWNMGGLYA